MALVISKKKVIASADVRISAQNQVMSKKKGLSVRRCSNFGPKLSDEQKKVIASADVQILVRNQKNIIVNFAF